MNMPKLKTAFLFGLLWAGVAVLTGCTDDRVAVEDVEDARIEAEREAAELAEAERRAENRIAEKREDLEQVIAEEQEELAEVRAEAREAELEADELSEKFHAQEAREQYLEDQQFRLAEAKREIDLYRERDDDLEGVALAEHEANVERLDEFYDSASETALKTAEGEAWLAERTRLEIAMQRLNNALNNVRNAN